MSFTSRKNHVVLISERPEERASETMFWQAIETVLGSVCDLEVDGGFERTIQDPEIDSKSSSMFGGRGMFGTFLLRNRLTTVMGNIVRI